MSIMHIFTIAETRVWNEGAQFRHHYSIPWDEAYELYLKPKELMALVMLAQAAQGTTHGLNGRVFDVLRAVRQCETSGPMQRRDHGPYAMVTPSSVWSRIELEKHLLTLSAKEWDTAWDMGGKLLKLAQTI